MLFNIERACRKNGFKDVSNAHFFFGDINDIRRRALIVTALSCLGKAKTEEEYRDVREKLNKRFKSQGFHLDITFSRRGNVKRFEIFAPALNQRYTYYGYRFTFKLI